MTRHDQPALRFSLLGTVRAFRGETELRLGPPQERLVLAILLLRAGAAVSADTMIDTVWGESAPPRALATVRTHISRLRRVLEPQPGSRSPTVVVRTPAGYALQTPAETVDVRRFDALVEDAEQARLAHDHERTAGMLRTALRLWQGEPLAGLPGDFADTQRARLDERRIAATELCLDSELALGRHREVLSELITLAVAYPLRERLQAQLMLALYRSGRQVEALEVYDRTRAFLVESLGIEPGPDLQQTHTYVLVGEVNESGVDGKDLTVGRAAGSYPRPRQLPAPAPSFTGREDEYAALRAVLATGPRPPVGLVSGIGGVGKTALTVQVAHAASVDYPDGQLYADLRGVEAEPSDPEEVLQQFLRALGVHPDALPAGPEECAALFRSVLADRRVLVLLDNAHSTAQVRPLLPGAGGCATLVTSRHRLPDLASTARVALEALSPDEARSMFAGIIGRERVAREPDAAAALVEAGGLLPLAVRILGARLAARPAWSLAALAGRLANERHRLDELSSGALELSASFRASYDDLDAALQRGCRLLATYTGPVIRVQVAAALLDLPEQEAEAVCERLTDAGLLESPAPGCYRFHDLLRLFAERCTPAAEQREGLRRLLELYVATGKAVVAALKPHDPLPAYLHATTPAPLPLTDPLTGAEVDDARDLIAAEAGGMLAACRAAAAADDDRARTTLLTLAADLTVMLWLTTDSASRWERLTDVSRQLATAAQRGGHQQAEGRARAIYGWLLGQGPQLDEGVAQLRQAARIGRESGDVFHRSRADYLLVGILLQPARYAEARAAAESALEGFREVGSRFDEATTLANLARVLAYLDEHAAAVDAAEQAIALHLELGSTDGEGFARYSLATAHYRAGDLEHAVAVVRQSRELFRRCGRTLWVGFTWLREAEVQVDRGATGAALSAAEHAVESSRELGHRFGLVRSLMALGKAARLGGDVGRARESWQQAYDLMAAADAPLAVQLRDLLDGVAAEGS